MASSSQAGHEDLHPAPKKGFDGHRERGAFFPKRPFSRKKKNSAYLPANRARARPAAMPLAQAQCRL